MSENNYLKMKITNTDISTTVEESPAEGIRVKISGTIDGINNSVNIPLTSTLDGLVSAHNNSNDAHLNLFGPINSTIEIMENKLALKAETSSVPTKVSQLENDKNYLNCVDDKADISLNNLTDEGLAVIKNQLKEVNLPLNCINSAPDSPIINFSNNTILIRENISTSTSGNTVSMVACSLDIEPTRYKNIAKPENAVGSTVYSPTPYSTPSKAFDGDLSTGFTTLENNFSKRYLGQINLTQKIEYIQVSNNLFAQGTALKTFYLEYSNDGLNFTPLANYTLDLTKMWNTFKLPDYPVSSMLYMKNLISNGVGAGQNTSVNEIRFLVQDPTGNMYLDETQNVIYNPQGELEVGTFDIYEQSTQPSMKVGDLWFKTDPMDFGGYKMTENGLVQYEFTKIGKVYLTDGAVVNVEDYAFNSNEYEMHHKSSFIGKPDYSSELSLANGILFTAPADGWLRADATGFFTPSYPISKGESFTPNSANFKYYRTR